MSCPSGKTCFITRSYAKSMIKYIKKAGKGKRHTNYNYLRVYRCEKCNHWHMTSSEYRLNFTQR